MGRSEATVGIALDDLREHALDDFAQRMSVIYGKCINRFCKITDPEGIKYTEYDTSGSMVEMMADGKAISATDCAPNREGLLCGQCKKGYSLTMYYTVSGSDQSCIDQASPRNWNAVGVL